MPALALAVIGIALPDSLNPTLILGVLYVGLGKHALRRTLGFTVAAFAVTLAGGVAIALGLGDLVLSLLPKLSHAAKWRVMTAAGILLIAGAAVMWWRRRSLASDPSARAPRGGGSSVLAGAGIAAVELLSAFPYFAAIALVVGSSVSGASKLTLLVIYNVIYVLPLVAVVVVVALMGEQSARVLRPIGDWVAVHWPTVVAPLIGAVGVLLTVYGTVQLT